MIVEVISMTDLNVIQEAGRVCYASEKRGDVYTYIRMLLASKHLSVLEHGSITFRINNLPRYILHELARHRIGIALSVESTRYTLKKLINDTEDSRKFHSHAFLKIEHRGGGKDNELVEHLCDDLFYNVKRVAEAHSDGVKPDNMKRILPESWLCNLVCTINLRQLLHMFQLRLSKEAHERFRELMILMFKAIVWKDRELASCIHTYFDNSWHTKDNSNTLRCNKMQEALK